MASLSEFAAAIIVYAPLMFAVMLSGDSTARELRPSEHGLVFQISPPAGVNFSLEMRSFFNSGSSSPSSTSYGVAVPKAMNYSGSLPPPWWRGTSGGHFGGALMVASLVCGITGVTLLVASGLLYLFKHRRKPQLNESLHGDNDNTSSNTNKLQLVVRNP